MFALVDCNNFYASCERVFRPDLNGKPIVVLSNNDGCVIARSNEAKAIGIPMGAPAFQFEELFQENNVAVFSANFALYGDMSQRVMSILSEHCPRVEIYSIDEAFLDFKGMHYFDLKNYSQTMCQKVIKGTGIPISIGIAATRSLAKVANRIAKKFPQQTQGVHIIDTEEKRIKALKWLAVGDVWGIGRQHSKRLQAIGVKTAYDFTQLNDSWIKKHLSIVGLRLKRDLEGEVTIQAEEVTSKKNIATTRSFEKNYTKIEELAERVSTFAFSCSEKLRAQRSHCNTLLLFLHTNGNRKDLPQYHKSIVLKLPFPTHSAIELAKFSNIALKKIFKSGFHYKKAGLIVMNFTPENEQQLSLFENNNPRHIALMKTVDLINKSFGSQKVRLAAQDQKRVWKMKQEKLSPRYTTKLSDIITIRV